MVNQRILLQKMFSISVYKLIIMLLPNNLKIKSRESPQCIYAEKKDKNSILNWNHLNR